jgi:hypothetical protein
MYRARELFIITFCVVTMLIASCVGPMAVGPRFSKLEEPKSGYALVYLWREFPYGYGSWPDIYFNSTKVVGLLNSGYTYVYVRPGKYHIHFGKSEGASEEWSKVDITVSANESYFLDFAVVGYDDRDGYVLPTGSAYAFVPPSHVAKRKWILNTLAGAKIALPGYQYVQPYVSIVE